MNARDLPISRDAIADPDVVAANAHADSADAAPPTADHGMATAKVAVPASAAGQSRFHESARAQVRGAATYVDDIAELKGTLYAAPILSKVAHGNIRNIDCAAALAMPGVVDVVLARDVPGDRTLAAFAGDEPIFAEHTVQHVGQVIGVVVASSVMEARRAARKVACAIDSLPALLDVHAALAAKSYVLPPVFVKRGDAQAALAAAPHTLHGTLQVGGQEHFYLEGQVAYAVPPKPPPMRRHSTRTAWLSMPMACATQCCTSPGCWVLEYTNHCFCSCGTAYATWPSR